MERLDYFLRRLLLVIPTFIGITFICFAITRLVPGGPVEQFIMQMKGVGSGEAHSSTGESATISPELRKQLEEHYHLDKPFYRAYAEWLFKERMGMRMASYKFSNKTAWQLIRERFPVSLVFGITGFLLSYLVCVPLGIAKALRHGNRFDLASSAVVFVGYAIPAFAFGMILKMFFCGTVDALWDVFPVSGFEADNFAQLGLAAQFRDRFTHMFLPVLCYMIGSFAVLTLLMKNSLLDQVGSDYVRTVLAKGGTRRRAIWGHALRNSLIPVATGFGRVLTIMFAGSVIIEQVFEIPGMGRLGLEAIVGRDYPVFMGILALTSLLSLVGNILSDFCYVLIDPRISFENH